VIGRVTHEPGNFCERRFVEFKRPSSMPTGGKVPVCSPFSPKGDLQPTTGHKPLVAWWGGLGLAGYLLYMVILLPENGRHFTDAPTPTAKVQLAKLMVQARNMPESATEVPPPFSHGLPATRRVLTAEELAFFVCAIVFQPFCCSTSPSPFLSLDTNNSVMGVCHPTLSALAP
jgi:hypothetical protein